MHKRTLENDMAIKWRGHVWYHNIAYDWLPLLYHIQTWVGNEKAQLIIYSHICMKVTTLPHCIMARDNTDKHLNGVLLLAPSCSQFRESHFSISFFFLQSFNMFILYKKNKALKHLHSLLKCSFTQKLGINVFFHIHQNSCSQADFKHDFKYQFPWLSTYFSSMVKDAEYVPHIIIIMVFLASWSSRSNTSARMARSSILSFKFIHKTNLPPPLREKYYSNACIKITSSRYIGPNFPGTVCRLRRKARIDIMWL